MKTTIVRAPVSFDRILLELRIGFALLALLEIALHWRWS